MKAYRRDATHNEVAKGLAGLGWLVWDLAKYGATIDLLVCVGDDLYLVDAKTPKSGTGRTERTEAQDKMTAQGWPVIYATTAQSAADQIAARRRAPIGAGLQ